METERPQKYYSVKIGVDPVCPVPTTILEMSIGCSFIVSEPSNNDVYNIIYFSKELTQAEAIELTTVKDK